jgi:hypothetical protein
VNKRIYIKKFKNQAITFLKNLDPTLKFYLVMDKNDEDPSRYSIEEHAIYYNYYHEKIRVKNYNEKINISLVQLMMITVAHEYAHSTKVSWKGWNHLHRKLFSNYDYLSDFEKWNNIIRWRKYIIGEEIRAWNIVRTLLKSDILEHVIKDCLDSYQYSVEIAVYALEKYKNELKKVS